jgi:hypothetical protein
LAIQAKIAFLPEKHAGSCETDSGIKIGGSSPSRRMEDSRLKGFLLRRNYGGHDGGIAWFRVIPKIKIFLLF